MGGRLNAKVMKRTTKLVIALAVTVIVLGLFLIPVVPITVGLTCPPGVFCFLGHYPASASMMYAYFGVGAVQLSGMSGGHAYCLMYGNPGIMCGFTVQRMG